MSPVGWIIGGLIFLVLFSIFPHLLPMSVIALIIIKGIRTANRANKEG